MLLQRVELNLYGPDDYPADEGSADTWDVREAYAKKLLTTELQWLKERVERRLRDPGFELEILGTDS